MNPVKTFDEISKNVLMRYGDMEVVTIGVLVVDGRQSEAKEYIVNYLNLFDVNSGIYFDFYIPGYYEKVDSEKIEESLKYHPNSCVRVGDINTTPLFRTRRNNKAYYFDEMLFENFLSEMKDKMGVDYTYNPMLLLIEVNRNFDRAQIEYQKKMVIELDEDSNRGLRRAGELFDKIFDIAKEQVNLSAYGHAFKMHYIKGKAVDNFVKVLEGNWIETVRDVAQDVLRFRIR